MHSWATAAVVTTAFTCGMLLISYEHLGDARAWPVARFLRGSGWLHALGIVEVIAAITASFAVLPWWWIFVTVVGGTAIGFVLSEIFRGWVQVIAIVGAVACFVLAPAYVW